MKIPRFRLRTMMVAVSVLALGMGLATELRRRVEYRQFMASVHDEAFRASEVWFPEGDGLYALVAETTDPQTTADDELVRPGQDLLRTPVPVTDIRLDTCDFHRRMAAKWLYAARYPWRPVAPDPPPPN